MGVDPGVTGALAVIEAFADKPPRLVAMHDLPTIEVKMSARTARRLDPTACGALLDVVLPMADRVVVERLTGGPGIATTTAFSLGWTAATLDTLLVTRGVRYKLASPSSWKRALLVPPDKAGARRRATALFGTDKGWPREKDHNRAEAALIGLWGALTK